MKHANLIEKLHLQNSQCHSKGTSDFAFQGGSSSMFCTTGHSTDGKNVALWDTLMPQRRSLVESYNFHESGASALLFAPQHWQLVTAGKKGQVAIWDIRQHRQLHAFKAHDHPVKCLALDPNEDFFVTGSVDGDIKVALIPELGIEIEKTRTLTPFLRTQNSFNFNLKIITSGFIWYGH